MRTLIIVVPIIALLLAIAACQGDAGPAGERGPAGEQGQPGTTGPKGPPGETAPVDEATVASLIEQMQQQSEAAESVPLKSTPSDYTKSFVRAAIGRYESDGLEATLAYYNTQESIDGQWYMFIMDQENMMLAHAANPDLVGRPVSAAVGTNGYPAGEAVAAVADEDGAWFGYTFINPRHRRWGDEALLDSAARRAGLWLRMVRKRAPQVRRPSLHQGFGTASTESLRRLGLGGCR